MPSTGYSIFSESSHQYSPAICRTKKDKKQGPIDNREFTRISIKWKSASLLEVVTNFEIRFTNRTTIQIEIIILD